MPIKIKRPPLSTMMHHPVHEINRLGLTVEGSDSAGLSEMKPYADVFVTAHGPYKKNSLRLNPASTEDDFREESVKIIEDFIDMTTAFPKLTQINLHFGCVQRIDPEQTYGRQGDYNLQIKSFQRIADFAAERDKEIVLENSVAYWNGISDDQGYATVDWSKQNLHYGTDPEEWIKICEDVNRPNVGLCLDTSHSCTYAHMYKEDERVDVLFRFLERPDLIKHVHWSDNYLYDERGRKDSHEILGRGTEPIEFHREIKGLDAIILIETLSTIQELEEELKFIDSL